RQTSPVSPPQAFSLDFVPNPVFSPRINDSDYFGYSVSSGTFVRGQLHYVAGAPRGADSRGKVLVFQFGEVEESSLQVLVERSGDQVGEYFGASVTAVDVNGDGLSDLVVGAPLYSEGAAPDRGAVYVFLNSGGGQVRLQGERLRGEAVAGGRFGSVVASPGDLNLDGFLDLVVGAPYEGGGAVYVFLGGAGGLRRQYSQRIGAEDVPQRGGRPLAGFGISISRGADVDKNLYPGGGLALLAGVFLFRFRHAF
ncbi:integrin alpha-PS5-like, partial [Hyalella azteca]|uniref:Integrin alpha-PS5-like n=1 Tax=Hyalella azteca TaxID=294128 RepID=A0A979FXE3_HYAAZ